MDPCSCARPIEPPTFITCNGPCRRRFISESVGFWNLSEEQLSYVLYFCNWCQRELQNPTSAPTRAAVVNLPEEVLEMIFQYLNYCQLAQVRKTCHRWKGVVDGSTALTRKFFVKFPRDIMMDRDYDPVCLPPAGSVKIRQTRIVTIDPWWSSFGTKLVEIILNDCIISLPGLANMLRQTPNVKILNFDSLYCPEIYDVATLANFLLDQMEVLVLTNCVLSIHDLLRNVCTRITTFHSMQTQANEVQPDADETLEYLEKWQNTLESIQVTPSESTLSALNSMRILRLTSLCVVCNFIRTDQLMPFLQRFQNLKSLKIIGIDIPDSALRDIGRNLPALAVLVVEINRETTWNMSFLNAFNLEQFRVVHNQPPINNAGSTVVNFHGCRCQKLQQLELYGLEPSDWDDFYEFFNGAPNLHSVTLSAISIDAWSDVFETLPMTKLRYLSLSAIILTTDVILDSLVEYYENLRCLKLDSVTMYVQSLQVLFRLCPNLEVVSIRYLGGLDDFSVLVLCQKLKRLSELTIYACPITNVAIEHIIEHCKELERLDIQNCPGITPAVIDQIRQSWLNDIMGRVMRYII